MDPEPEVQAVLLVFSSVALVGLVLFQYLHQVVGAWRHFADNRWRPAIVAGVASLWQIHGLFYLVVILSVDVQEFAMPLLIGSLYQPVMLVLLVLAFSPEVRQLVDGVPLCWLIETVAGPARTLLGVVYFVWYFAGRIPAIVAFVAGPGYSIGGYLASEAVRRLQPFADHAKLTARNWSAADYQQKAPKGKAKESEADRSARVRGLKTAFAIVLFGVLHLIAASALEITSIQQGVAPRAARRFPLVLIPSLVLPQILVLQIFALRQLWILRDVHAKTKQA